MSCFNKKQICKLSMTMCKLFISLLFGMVLGSIVDYFTSESRASKCILSKPNDSTKSDFLLVSVTLNNNQAYENDKKISIIKETWGSQLKPVNINSYYGNIAFYDMKDHKEELKYFANQDIVLFKQKIPRPIFVKKFLILNHIRKNYINRFKWFVITNDETYTHIPKLTKMLKTMDYEKEIYLGRPQLIQYKTLNSQTRNMDIFCEEGSGIVISNGLLKKIVSIKDCLENLITFEYGVELGRCIKKYTKVECTKSHQTTQEFFRRSQHYTEGVVGQIEGKNTLPDINEIQNNFIDKLTYFPIPNDLYLVRLHIVLLKQQIKDKLDQIHLIEQQIKKHIRKPPNLNETSTLNQIKDNLWLSPIVMNRVFTLDESSLNMRQMHKKWQPTLKTVKKLMYNYLNMDVDSKQQISIKGVYYKISPIKAVEFIGLFTQYEEVKYQKTNRLKTKQVFWDPMIREDDIDINKKIKNHQEFKPRVVLITTVSGRVETLKTFCRNFEKEILRDKHLNVRIIFVVFQGLSEKKIKEAIEIQNVLNQFTLEHGKELITTIYMIDDKFSRGKGLQEGINSIKTGDPILFLCDIDLKISKGLLQRIRKNTKKGMQVYYPTFLSQFDPKILSEATGQTLKLKDYQNNCGFWRHFSYGMISLYASDFKRTKGFDLSIEGWGLEDVQFCQSVITEANLEVFKCPDPDLTHIYHDKHCTVITGQQLSMCKSTKFSHYGSKETLSKYWHNLKSQKHELL